MVFERSFRSPFFESWVERANLLCCKRSRPFGSQSPRTRGPRKEETGSPKTAGQENGEGAKEKLPNLLRGKKERNATKKRKTQKKDYDVEDGLRLRKKRATKDDEDFVPDEQDKRGKKETARATESNQRVNADQVSLQKRNQSLDGTWVLQDCDDVVDGDLVLKLAKNGKTMSGNCVISGCQVRLTCSDLQNEEVDFRSVFKTQKTSFVGRMLIRLLDKGNAIKISYSNGASGQAGQILRRYCKKEKVKQLNP